MEWLKKHVDTVIVLSALLSAVLWMNGKFNEVDGKFNEVGREMDRRFSQVEKDISQVDKEIAVIKAVLIMKNIMPTELAHKADKEEME